ncbi:fumarylacetoacetate hydrolase family protein [Vibrio sp.]|nr:fumarylacetoacetate hydrolase family protein [Vibrio sp.]
MKTIHSPMTTPSKIICIGRNYVEHIKELGNEIPDNMVIFLKPNSAISDTLLSKHQEAIHFESELCFQYSETGLSTVGFGFDLTKRGLQSKLKEKGLPWERSKAFTGSAVFSAFVPFNGNTHDIRFEVERNGSVIQKGDDNLMMYKPRDILIEIQSFMDLEEGDIIMTGTPKGVGQLNKGDEFIARVYQKETLLIEQGWIVV